MSLSLRCFVYIDRFVGGCTVWGQQAKKSPVAKAAPKPKAAKASTTVSKAASATTTKTKKAVGASKPKTAAAAKKSKAVDLDDDVSNDENRMEVDDEADSDSVASEPVKKKAPAAKSKKTASEQYVKVRGATRVHIPQPMHLH